MITRSQTLSRKSTQNSNLNHHFNQVNKTTIRNSTIVLTDIIKSRKAQESKLTRTKPCKVLLQDIQRPDTKTFTLNSNVGEGKLSRIIKCKSKKWELKQFKDRDRVESSCTKRLYDCVTSPGTVYLNCHSTNLIYLLTCATYGLQYVGETVQTLSSRFSGHRSGIKDPNKYGKCKILSNYFNAGILIILFRFLKRLKVRGRTERKAIDVSVSSHRKQRENYWIRTLRTAYLYK